MPQIVVISECRLFSKAVWAGNTLWLQTSYEVHDCVWKFLFVYWSVLLYLSKLKGECHQWHLLPACLARMHNSVSNQYCFSTCGGNVRAVQYWMMVAIMLAKGTERIIDFSPEFFLLNLVATIPKKFRVISLYRITAVQLMLIRLWKLRNIRPKEVHLRTRLKYYTLVWLPGL